MPVGFSNLQAMMTLTGSILEVWFRTESEFKRKER